MKTPVTNPVTVLKSIGCRSVGHETTGGCRHYWLTYPGTPPDTMEKLKRVRLRVRRALGVTEKYQDPYNPRDFYTPHFDLSFQREFEDGHFGICISKPRLNYLGYLYRKGIDT